MINKTKTIEEIKAGLNQEEKENWLRKDAAWEAASSAIEDIPISEDSVFAALQENGN